MACDNFDGLSCKQIEGAAAACCKMGMVATLLECDFQGLVHHNLLEDCPITYDDVKLTHRVFGPDLASIRGKTVRCKPTRVITDYVDIPRALVDVFLTSYIGRRYHVCEFSTFPGVSLTQH